ncbi:MAG: outer rane transport family protein [Rhodocyclales bacterium]|nr:outer rane transport family protein [Rhodocyclales bacterium]
MMHAQLSVMAVAMAFAFAQSATAADTVVASQPLIAASLHGVVRNAKGQAQADAVVTLQDGQGHTVASTHSGPDGIYVFAGLPPGPYTAHALAGDAVASSEVLTLAAGNTDAEPLNLEAPRSTSTVEVVGRRLDRARNGLSPDTGSSIYRMNEKDIAALPQGNATPFNQVLLQAPGVVQDSYGQLHVRGDHSNLQYRVNGVVIPEAMSGFGQALDARFAHQINVLTGALPAQYGYRTAGVVDISSRDGLLDKGGSVTMTTGNHGNFGTDADVAGVTSNGLSYFLSGSYLSNNQGIENPTTSHEALHDRTEQSKSFGYFSYLLNDTSRLNFLFGNSDSKFQIPNVPGQTPDFSLAGVGSIDSASLDARQHEKSAFQITSLQSSLGNATDFQLSLFHSNSSVQYRPDPVGDLMFNGVAADINRRIDTVGLQGDMSWRASDTHTVRSGIYTNHQRTFVDNTSQVFPLDAGGDPLDTPKTIVDNTRLNGGLFGVYLQDEWKLQPALTLNYGARYDTVHTVSHERQLSPRIGLVYDISTQTRLHAGYARYFTPPPTEKIDNTSVAKFDNTSNALPSDANTSVMSERSHYFDAGITHQLTANTTIGLDTYYRRVRNLQDEGQFGNALIFSAFNFKEGRIYGSELTASYHGSALSAYANVGYSIAQGRNIVTGQFNFGPDELDYIANHWVHLDHDQHWTASTGVSYLWQGTTVGVDALYGSGLRRGFANTDHMPGYVQVNVGASRPFEFAAVGKMSARLAIINLLDHSYALRDGSGIGVGAPQYGPRRTVTVSLSKFF